MWNAIAYVSSGFTLAAFLAAVAAWSFKAKIDERERLINSAKADERADLVKDALEFFHVDPARLTKEQQYDIAVEQIRARAQRFKVAAAVICFLALVAGAIAIYAITSATKPSPAQPDHPPATASPSNSNEAPAAKTDTPKPPEEVIDEGRFRIRQIDEVFESALALQTRCFDQLAAERAVDGASIRDYLNSVQVVATAFELGGIYRPPGKDDAIVWIGTSGYGVRHLPNRRTYKNAAFSDKDMRDLLSEAPDLSHGASSTTSLDPEKILENLRNLAKFTETDVLADWFKRHQAQGEYQQKYGSAYKVYEVKVDDYGEKLNRVKNWLDQLRSEWERFKGTLKARELG